MPGRKRKDSEVEETTEMAETQEATPAPELNITMGLSPIKRTRNGAGRKREPNPFDEHINAFYEAKDPAGVEFSDEEHRNRLQNQIKNAVTNYNKENDASLGVEFGVDKDMPSVLKFNVKDKVSGRGRKPGSKKIDGHFYSPEELDADGNPTPEARAAKENPSASAAEKVDA